MLGWMDDPDERTCEVSFIIRAKCKDDEVLHLVEPLEIPVRMIEIGARAFDQERRETRDMEERRPYEGF